MGSDDLFKINPEKAREIAEDVHRQYKRSTGFFKDCEPPNYEPPKGMIMKSKEHALYLTYIFALDQDVESGVLWSRARRLYEEIPWFFDAKQILTRSDEGLSEALKRLGVSNINTLVKKWKTISKILLEDYSGDPRRPTNETLDLERIRARIREVLGTSEQRRIRRYLQIMTANKLMKLENSEILGVFVDNNVAVFTIYTGVLQFGGELFEGFLDGYPILPLTRKAWSDAAAGLGIPPWELDEPIRIVSSRLCSEMKCILCPIREKCEKRFRLEINGNRVRLEKTTKVGEPYPPRFCVYCGRDLSSGAKFCDWCGRKNLGQMSGLT